MKWIRVRETVLGDGRPKICGIIDGSLREDLLQQIDEATEAGAELIEWRADTYSWFQSHEKVLETLQKMREKMQNMPLLFNFRTIHTGGSQEISIADYRELYLQALSSKCVDIFEVELDLIEQLGGHIIQKLQEGGAKVILNDTYLTKTPEDSLLLFRLNLMEHLGADLGKIVVCPANRQEVFRLMEITLQAEAFVQLPIVTISLGELGRFSRVCGELNGSALAYAVINDEPKNGEFSIYDLVKALELVQGKWLS